MSASAEDGSLDYAYRPSVLGAPIEFRLTGDALDWTAGRKAGRLALRDIRRVSMSFKPASMQPYRFVTQLWAKDTPRLDIVSTSWKSMVEQERLDVRYVAFVRELHRRIAIAAAPARFVQGKHPLVYWPGLVLFAIVGVLLAAMVPRALDSHTVAGAVFIAAFLALFLWQGGNFFRRNIPGNYRPDALPPALLPKGGGKV